MLGSTGHAARLSHTKCTKTIRPRESADDPPASRPPFSADPGADQRARAHPACHRQGHDRSSRPRLPTARPRGAGRTQGRVQDRGARHRLPRLGHRRLGGGAGQHRIAGRPAPDVRDRAFRGAVARAGAPSRFGTGTPARRLALGRGCGRHRRAACRRPGARDQGRLHRPQRDLDRRHQQDRADPPGHRPGRPPGPADGRHDLVPGLDRLPARRVGCGRDRRRLAEGPDAAARPELQRGLGQGAGGAGDRAAAALLLGLGGDAGGQSLRASFPTRPRPT